MPDPLSPKQVEFIVNADAKWNLAHGSVRSGKTVCTVFAFMAEVDRCPDSRIYIVGHTFDSALSQRDPLANGVQGAGHLPTVFDVERKKAALQGQIDHSARRQG